MCVHGAWKEEVGTMRGGGREINNKKDGLQNGKGLVCPYRQTAEGWYGSVSQGVET